MRVGVPKEIKVHEYRVGLTPQSVRVLSRLGAEVFVETNAGTAIGFDDTQYQDAGAKIIPNAKGVFDIADMIVKVKEPQPQECQMLREGQYLFTYLHLAPDPEQTKALLASGCIAIAYETVTDNAGRLPLLAPMSEVAGRMSIQAGAHALEIEAGGRGLLLAGVPGVPSAKVVILGAGVAGSNALQMAVGLQADVTILDISHERLVTLDALFGSRIKTLFSNPHNVEESVIGADLVIGAVLIPGASAPKLVKREHLKRMKKGSVLVDIAIDQGGCFETSHPTTHSQPTFVEEGIVHYCVANMPGAVACTSALALNNITLPFVQQLVQNPLEALKMNKHLRNGLNIFKGNLTCEPVARALNLPYVDPTKLL